MRLLHIFRFLFVVAIASLPLGDGAITNRHSPQRTRSHSFYRSRCRFHAPLSCALRPTIGNTAEGLVTFRASHEWRGRHCRVEITATVHKLSEGAHGFHIHTFGDVRAADGTSAGGHFTNPGGEDIPHGLPDDRTRHWGDLGNIIANTSGVATYSRIDHVITLDGIIGRAVVIHAIEDQGASQQPTGAAGSRQSTCVIGYANPEV